MIEFREHIDPRGRNFFRRWRDDLDDIAAARVTVALDRLFQGNFS
jgi:putative component of toxin-antitoxin plasmid stabilization module